MSNPSTSGQQRFLQNIVDSEFFQSFQQAFTTLVGLTPRLEASDDPEATDTLISQKNLDGVIETRVPVSIGRKTIAYLRIDDVRLHPTSNDDFTPMAHAMLGDDCSAAEIREARRRFDDTHVMSEANYQAALVLLRTFALQLGENAHRMLFAQATHEPEAVRNAKSYIHAHLAEPMTLESVAKAVHVSPFHFCKLFKRATGLTFTDFVSRARVEKAKRLLMKPAARITEVAYDVGFQSLSHFNRSFRRVSRESPTEFRSRMRVGPRTVLVA